MKIAGLTKLDGFQVEIDEAHERADIILNRPPYNVVSMPQRDQLRLVFETLDEDARVRIIVVRSVGEHFSSGGNIGGFMEATPETVSKLAWNIASPTRCAKPVIVANRGYCFGVGFELSLACDFRIASETTLYALPEQKLGQIPGSGGSARLQKMIGITRTKDIVMRSKRIPAKQAFDWGIATECVPDAELEKVTDKLVDELRTFAPLAQRTAKKLLNDTEDFDADGRDRTGRPLLQPSASIGRFQGRRRSLQRQTSAEIRRALKKSFWGETGRNEMTIANIEGAGTASPVAGRQMRNAIIASVLGWSLDLFDLFILLYVAPVVGALFFPSSVPTLSLAAVYASFAVTLLMRPVGSAIFGHYADVHGRKNAMLVGHHRRRPQHRSLRCCCRRSPRSGSSRRCCF